MRNFAQMKKKSIFHSLLIFGFIAFLGISFAFFFATKVTKPSQTDSMIKDSKRDKVLSASVAVTVIPTVQPTVTSKATPTTASISATPVPAGYCLNVPVLFYHHIQPLSIAAEHKNTSLTVDNEIFDTQMQYLVNHGYTTITTKQLVEALKGHTTLAPKSVAVSLDDGYKDNYTYAFPILQKYHLTANIMLATGLVGGADYLTWSQVEEMHKSGLVHYTDHTWSHYAISSGTTDKIQYEIQTAKQQIEAHTGEMQDIFTYPYGAFNDRAIGLLKQDGFIGAFSTLPGKLQCDSYIMSLHRTRIGNASLASYGF